MDARGDLESGVNTRDSLESDVFVGPTEVGPVRLVYEHD